MKKETSYSKEHLLYLKGVRQKSTVINAMRFLVLFVLLTIWELSARFEWINPFITSSPSRIIKTIGELY